VLSASSQALEVDMRVNRALIDINRKKFKTDLWVPGFSRFSTSRLMKNGNRQRRQSFGSGAEYRRGGAEKISKIERAD